MDKGFKGTINLNGRPKGAPNVVTAAVRDRFNLLVENNIDKLQKDISTLEPYQRIKVIIELSKFILPQLKSIDIAATIEENKPEFQTVIVQLIKANGEDKN